MALLLGIDVGSTVLKAVVFDAGGKIMAIAEEKVRVRQPQPDWVERDAGETWRAVARMLRHVSRERAGEITAIGITGCGNGAVFLDERGRPLRAGILANDTRATAFMPPAGARPGQQSYPGQLSILLSWLRTKEPEKARRLSHILFWKDFIRGELTDVIRSDYTDAGAAGLLRYPGRTLRQADPSLPSLQGSLAPAGEITRAAAAKTGLASGTPVFTGCIDCEATAIGSGVLGPNEISIVAGTWSINQQYIARPPRHHRHFLVNESVEAGRWLVLEASPSSVANFDWARRAFGARLSPTQAVEEARRSRRSGLLFYPEVPTNQGAFVGLAASHGRGELLRAVMEGVVFAHREHVEKLPGFATGKRRVVLAGGAARNPFWCQLFADGLGCRIDVPAGEQLGALGAAICAGVGAGIWPSITAAQRSMVPPSQTYFPEGKMRAELDRSYARFVRHREASM